MRTRVLAIIASATLASAAIPQPAILRTAIQCGRLHVSAGVLQGKAFVPSDRVEHCKAVAKARPVYDSISPLPIDSVTTTRVDVPSYRRGLLASWFWVRFFSGTHQIEVNVDRKTWIATRSED